MEHPTHEYILVAVLFASWIALLYVVIFPPLTVWAEPNAPDPPPVREAPQADVPPPAPVAVPRSTSTVTLRLMCADETCQHAHVQIPAASRRPTFTHRGGVYVASRKDERGDWVYRFDRSE